MALEEVEDIDSDKILRSFDSTQIIPKADLPEYAFKKEMQRYPHALLTIGVRNADDELLLIVIGKKFCILRVHT
ncbi:hypothetical protein OESDEN_13567 [Oesophagostomum dentatum]|uniref:Uncharacterized protein n=1 Tax=Oesophagostomum dentatum TaxID=61180 RepID=A0A0B1SU38_OESDE|nr:hypothetical protein OESDEN_13567 [Oesophagostomum dentatum]